MKPEYGVTRCRVAKLPQTDAKRISRSWHHHRHPQRRRKMDSVVLSKPHRPLALLLLFLYLLILPSTTAIKFNLPAYRYPSKKCIWNQAHTNTLVIVTANVGPGPDQRTDIEIVDSSPKRNVYLSKRNINGETRLAITTHADGEVGVCLLNHLEPCK